MSVFEAHQRVIDAARRIEEDWRRTDNRIRAFPEIVAEAVDGQDFSALGDLAAVSRLLEDPWVASLQEPSTFSDLYLKIYDNGRFYVELLNWWGSDINIHDHDFSGMQFQLTGSSLNVEYAFTEEHWSPKLTFGEVSVRAATIWEEGDTSFVYPGPASTHTVSHLGFPTVSMLIRTHGAAEYGPQRNYFPPLVAGDYGVADIVFRKRIGLLRVLARSADERFDHAFRRIVAVQTPTENLFTMMKLFDILFSGRRAHLLRELVSNGGTEAEAMVAACAYHRASDLVLNTVKRVGGLGAQHVLTASVLGSSFDPGSFTQISGDVGRKGYDVDLRGLSAAVERLRPELTEELRNVLTLFGLTDAVSDLWLATDAEVASGGREHAGR